MKNKKTYPKTIALLDLDGVVANFQKLILSKYNTRFNANLSLDSWTKFDVDQIFGKDVWEKMEEIYNEPGFFYEIEPYEGAIETVRKILDLVNVEICSSPTKRTAADGRRELNPHCAHDKYLWVHKYLPELSSKITLTNSKQRIKADFLIDDGMHNVAPWCKNHPDGFAFVVEQPWNKSYRLPRNSKRVLIQEIPNLITEKVGNSLNF